MFSYTQAGAPFYNQGWLAQVLLYGLYDLGGVPLILVVQSAVITLAYGLLLWLCIRRSGALRLSVAVLLLTLPLVFGNWNVRPQSYAFPLFAGFLVILTTWWRSRSLAKVYGACLRPASQVPKHLRRRCVSCSSGVRSPQRHCCSTRAISR
jgi:hypothetical protein